MLKVLKIAPYFSIQLAFSIVRTQPASDSYTVLWH